MTFMNSLRGYDQGPIVKEATMPFDAIDPPIEVIFQERRERAAAFWKSIPIQRFEISSWENYYGCGTTACALGWLANAEFEGWKWGANRVPVAPGDHHMGFWAAVGFFGLRYEDAMQCFDVGHYSSKPRPSTVAKRLLQMPIVVPQMTI